MLCQKKQQEQKTVKRNVGLKKPVVQRLFMMLQYHAALS